MAKKFNNPENFFLEPIPSKVLGIFVVDSNIFTKEIFDLNEIKGKLMALPYKSNLLLIFLVHFS